VRNLKKIKLLLLLFISIALTQSCDKDDMVKPASVEEETTAEVKEDENDSATETENVDPTNSSTDDITTEGGEDFGSITRYLVEGNNLVKEVDFPVTGKNAEFQKDTAKHQEIWEMTKSIIPASYRAKMSHFMIFAGEKDGVAGYVFQSEDDLSKWEMGIAIDLA